MIPAARSVDSLRKRRPEWSPWLAVIDDVQREAMTTRWDAIVPSERRDMDGAAPLLSGTGVHVDEGAVRRMLLRLVEIASRGGTPKMAALRPALRGDVDIAALFRASLRQDAAAIAATAADAGVDPDAMQAVVTLIAVPFLHACRRGWRTALPIDWLHGYCPVCGSWPAFAETRGIERTRALRCGRCGSEWNGQLLHCAFCGNHDHGDLTTLVTEQGSGAGVLEACRRCCQYVKVFTRLQGCAPSEVMLEDMASVDLDVAAIHHGYSRPPGAGCTVDVEVHAGRPRRALAGHA